jgi:queuine tRNA-ribosyltransferase
MTVRSFKIHQHELALPIFLPDATNGVVRSVDSNDLRNAGIQALVMNTFHLMQKPGSSTVQALGGLHQMCDWDDPIITDSGGFQAYSLIRQNPKFGSLSEKGILFKPEGSDRRLILTPEKSIQLQFSFDADVIICLDDCTHVDASYAEQVLSVERTIKWAKRCKQEYERQVENRKFSDEQRPLIFGVVQGGGYPQLRKQCADALLEIGFDGFGFGGWPLDAQSNLLVDILEYTRQVIPQKYLLHALGIGHPQNLVICHKLGYDIFDCAMPTRDARHGRLYVFTDPSAVSANADDWFKYRYINDEETIKARAPISEFCDCPCCEHYSLGYLHHLHKINENLYLRLATLHNLRFMTQLTEILSHA